MKTLIFNGSPRKCGDTMTFINEFIEQLVGGGDGSMKKIVVQFNELR